MANNESMEMYLETIYLLEKKQGHAHGVDIAKELSVSKASVTKFMNNLKTDGYITKEAYGSINLTKKGKNVAENVYFIHKLITKYLEHSLNVSTEVANENACKMEHVLTEDLIESIKEYLTKYEISY